MTETTVQSEPVETPERPAPHRARSIAGYCVLGGVMLISPLFVFLPAAVFQCGMRNGRRATWLMLIVAGVLAALVAFPASHAPATTAAEANASYAYLIGLVLAVGVPALVVLPMVKRGASFGRVLTLAIVLAIGGLAATELIMRTTVHFSPYADQVASAQQTAAKFVAAYQKAGVPSDAVHFLRKWMNLGIYCLPAFLLIDVSIVFVFSLIMLGRLRAWREFALHHAPPAATPYLFRNLSLPEWLLFAFVVGGLSPLASGMAQQIGANILALVSFLYLLQGLAIFRSFVVATGAGFAGSLFAYGLLGVLTVTGIAPLLLSIAGLFDSFFDFRHFNRKDHSDESHSH